MPYVVVFSYTLISNLLNAKNWLHPAVDCLDTSLLIIIPIKLSIV